MHAIALASTSTVHAYLQREARLQQRRDRLNAESTEERQARLQQRRDRLNVESPEERQARLQQRRDRLWQRRVTRRETGQATEKT